MKLLFRQMRWRIASAYIVLIVFVLAFLSLILLDLVRSTYLETLTTDLANHARLVATIVEERHLSSGPSPELDALVHTLSQRIDARVTVIGSDGAVLADSLLSPAEIGNIRERPEVQAVFATGVGKSTRSNPLTGDDMLYLAVPIGPLATTTSAARVGVPLTQVALEQTRLSEAVLGAALVAVAVALLLAVLIARRTTRPLLELRAMAGRLAAGDLTVRVPLPPDEEVAALAHDFNQMASQLRQTISHVETERERMATMLMTMPDGLLIVNDDDRITLINQAAEQLLQIAPPALPLPLTSVPVGGLLTPIVQQLHPQQPDLLTPVVKEIELAQPSRSLRAILNRLRGSEQHEIVMVLQDLTDLRHAERARRMALANISHDLRTPLAALQTLIEALQNGALHDETVATDFLARMDAEAESLSRLVQEFLQLSQIESGQIILHPAPTDLQTLLGTVAERMLLLAHQHELALQLVVPDPLPELALDRARMEQVLLNLVHNALAFTPPGGTLTLSAVQEGEYAVIRVHDTGIGIAPDDLPHIFEPFYKADQARSGGGTGLGLAIAKHLVERHGGRIQVASQVQQGTTFTISLPLKLLQDHR